MCVGTSPSAPASVAQLWGTVSNSNGAMRRKAEPVSGELSPMSEISVLELRAPVRYRMWWFCGDRRGLGLPF